MKLSKNGFDVIIHYESFFSKPYLCPADKATIGYGTTIYPNGKKVTLKDAPISEGKAIEYLCYDVSKFEADVNSLLKVPVTQGMFDALVCFAYNVGSDIDSDDIAEGLGDSTLLKLINQNIVATNENWKRPVTIEFLKWVWAKSKGKRQKLPGLIARRTTESLLATDGIVKFFN